MGAAGLGLFDSDHDFDSISDLDVEAGFPKLATELRAKDSANRPQEDETKSTEKAASINDADDDYDYRFSLHGSSQLTKDEFLAVRKHLESGVLDRMINARLEKIKVGDLGIYGHPGYELVLLAVCAMEYGCKLSEPFLDHLRRNIRSVGLMRDAVTQVDIALNDPEKCYKNDGTPYELQYIEGLGEADTLYPGGTTYKLLNTAAPFGLFRATGTAAVQPNTRVFAAHLCGGCGARKKEGGGDLMRCGKCRAMLYCCVACQKSDWKRHKAVCTADNVSGEVRSS